jgi:N-methylhydantoinase A/oxoprolinase/acetone carboxylase beta subunit
VTSTPATRVGTDTGGTFTDLVTGDGTVAKVPSTPADPGQALRHALARVFGDDAVDVLAHGTTVATNAVLERTGGPVALVSTDGFADVIEIGRQDRPSLYDTTVDRPAPLVDRHLRFEVRERLGADGGVVEPLNAESVAEVVDRLVELAAAGEVVAVAVCLLHADLNPTHERTVAEALRAAGLEVTASHEVSPEFREFERTATTVANAYLRPVCAPYLAALGAAAPSVQVMTSAGGLTSTTAAADVPARLLLSGPAGGVRAAAAVAAANGIDLAVSFDMGGTSTDVCLIEGGVPAPAAERAIDGLPVRLPSLDVHTIGAGGGSLASLDAGGALVVGPRSAGAVPGPACYGRGGTGATVTDANLVLGRIPADAAFPGLGTLDVAAATAALAAAGVDAAGVVQVVNASMEQALRAVTVERGIDARHAVLVAFGGAGPLHACELAASLDMAGVLVPARAGVFSAVGVLCAPDQEDLVRSWPTPLDHAGLTEARQALAAEATAVLLAGRNGAPDVEVLTALDCRYRGQSHELTVPDVDAFHAEHDRRNGYRRSDVPIEVIAVRATARLVAPVAPEDLPAGDRLPDEAAYLDGPAVLAEPDCTIWVPAGWRATQAAAGALLLQPVGAPQRTDGHRQTEASRS